MHSCRSCAARLGESFLSLGTQPLSNAFLGPDQLGRMEPTYPLDLFFCGTCSLVQLDEFERAHDIFSDDYPYFASFSESWLVHSRAYAELATRRFALDRDSFVVEVASNDGYLLQYFQQRGIPVLGIDPARSVAEAAREKGVPTDLAFFGTSYAEAMTARADLLIGNNVLAHVPDINDFVAGIARALKPRGVATLEFPHLLRMIEGNQFDTIYHEHFSYLSLHAVTTLFLRHGLEVFDVDELATHGGSLRVYAQAVATRPFEVSARVEMVNALERTGGLLSPSTYARFREGVASTKRDLLTLLIGERRAGKRIVGYGAPAKGNTLLNYCGIRDDFVEYTVDRNPHKQGRFLPGSHIPVHAPERILADKPDDILILPWNIKAEVMAQLSAIREWGGRFIIPVPTPGFVG